MTISRLFCSILGKGKGKGMIENKNMGGRKKERNSS
jgi:hypothetical protein